MVTQLTAGYFYFCDYLTAADGDAQDLAGKTAGTDYIALPDTLKFNSAINVDAMDDFYPGQEGYFMRWDKNPQVLTITGYTEDHDEADKIEEFLGRMGDNGSSATYFFWRRSSTANDFKKFNKGSTEYEYARGYIKNLNSDWNHGEQEVYTINIKFQVVWS